ncbi:MAG: copper homeostasis protein CutC [Chitinophagaceae bacterium]
MVKPLFELACFSATAVEQAQQLPIDRIELCSSYLEGGLTPSYGFLLEANKINKLITNVIVRPRSGNYIYSNVEQKIILRDIETIISLGYHGVVVGALTVNDQPDYKFLEVITEKFAAHSWLTFHRAFDHIPEAKKVEAIKNLSEIGFNAVLTSGVPNTSAILGINTITTLQSMLSTNNLSLQLVAGGGIHHAHAANLIQQSGVKAIHGACLQKPFTPDFRVDVTEVQAIHNSLLHL